MSLLENEIDEVLKTITPPDPVFSIKRYAYGKQIEINNQSIANVNSDSIIANAVLGSIHMRWDNKSLKFTISSENCRSSVINDIVDRIRSFIVEYSDSRNPKLTNLYKWYYKNLSLSTLDSYESFENILFEVYKYIQRDEENNIDNTFNILEVVKQKFEAKGLTI